MQTVVGLGISEPSTVGKGLNLNLESYSKDAIGTLNPVRSEGVWILRGVEV